MNSSELFAKVPLFQGLSDADRSMLAQATSLKRYRRGERILTQGQPGETLLVIVRGRVSVTVLSPDGREVVLGNLGEGDHFGEMALLDDSPRSASVVAAERAELAVLTRSVFFELLRSNISLTRALLASFSRRLRRANATIEGLASLDVKSRLARYFRELATSRGRQAGGGWVVVVRPAQREIADTIGTTRETVSRTMTLMAQESLIVAKGKVVYVKLEETTPTPAREATGARGARPEAAYTS
jgi:CRP/FNR family cyclic AMP-dependent transcriptional regulator